MKKWMSILMAGLMTVSALTACGNNETAVQKRAVRKQRAHQKARSLKSELFRLTEHPALDAAREGFEEGIKEAGLNCNIEVQNAQNDQSTCTTIATKFVNDDKDLILAHCNTVGTAGGRTDRGDSDSCDSSHRPCQRRSCRFQ